ncbi:hypothetical protein E2C01_024938 [Portunus trituberculatus]|uniref:Uncharacterized protein n=1 Tax=Portunus trituberculatus TaxID=210409 RepID=A0A5B7EF84_PORTR|nr:hypothetical protein [Portunus trituberculatus]
MAVKRGPTICVLKREPAMHKVHIYQTGPMLPKTLLRLLTSKDDAHNKRKDIITMKTKDII